MAGTSASRPIPAAAQTTISGLDGTELFSGSAAVQNVHRDQDWEGLSISRFLAPLLTGPIPDFSRETELTVPGNLLADATGPDGAVFSQRRDAGPSFADIGGCDSGIASIPPIQSSHSRILSLSGTIRAIRGRLPAFWFLVGYERDDPVA